MRARYYCYVQAMLPKNNYHKNLVSHVALESLRFNHQWFSAIQQV